MKFDKTTLLSSLITVASIVSIQAGSTEIIADSDKNPSPIIETKQSDWNVTFRPYLWAASLKGDIGAQGLVMPVDLPFSEIAENLDGAFALYTDINHGKWTLAIDFQYLKLSAGMDDFSFPLFSSVGVEVEQLIGSATVFYRVLEWEHGFLELGAGARVVGLKNKVNLSPDEQGIADFSDAAAAQISGAIADEVQRKAANAKANFVPPSGPTPPTPTDSLLNTATKGLNTPIRDEIKKRIIKKIIQAGPVRDKIKQVLKARVQEKLAATRDGIRSKAATKARQAREKAEEKLAGEINKQVTKALPSEIKDDAMWVDPIIAMRARHNFTEKIYGLIYADIGGFGVSSELTWQAGAGLGWQANSWLGFEVLYRHLSIDYQRALVFNAEQSGLFLGAVISF